MPHVLLIEDNSHMRAMLGQMISRAGYEVSSAADGDEGLTMLRAAPADVVVTDIIMPRREGIETILALRREFPGIPIVAISASGGHGGSADYLSMARKIGADAAFAKPIDRASFLDTLAELSRRGRN